MGTGPEQKERAVDIPGPAALEIEVAVAEAEALGQVRLTRVIVRTMMVCCGLGFAGLFLEEKNEPVHGLVLYGTIFSVLFVSEVLCRVGRSKLAGWVLTSTFWIIVLAATWFFGGLQQEIGAAYIVVAMIAGATIGSRASYIFGGLSILSAGFVAWAEATGLLPPSLSPPSPVNAWFALTVVLCIGVMLFRMTVKATRSALLSAARAMQEKDFVEEKYMHAQRSAPIARLASGVAHDFNNLLNVMSGVSTLMRDAEPEDRADLLDDLDLATARAALMTGQLLSLNRKARTEPRALDLTPIVETLTPLLSRLVGDEIEVQFSKGQGQTTVRVDPGQMEQLILNLAVNAREAMPRGGKLSLHLEEETRAKERWVRLEVTDTGEGMSKELIDQAFQAFFTTKSKGTGLGLATVHDIVDRHGGKISVRSRVGHGTTFSIELPHIEMRQEKDDVSQTISSPSNAARVLLVEDHDVGRRTARRLLEAAQHDVTAVANGQEALALVLASGRFDLIVTDVSMPVMDGTELARRLARDGSSTPVLFVSGHVQELPPEFGTLPFVTAFLPKPNSGDAFLEKVREMLVDREARTPATPSVSVGLP